MSGTNDHRPLIAVVGSFSAERDYRPPLTDPGGLRNACEEIGGEIARRGCDLLVFSGKEKYAETAAARGFLAASEAGPRTVVARLARHQQYTLEPGPESGARIRVVRDPSGEWEVPYYRALMETDGIVLAGGGRSTRVTGILALAQEIPVAPVSVFGAAAEQVWVHLDRTRNRATDEDLALLGGPWTDTSAGDLVDGLLRQAGERAREAARRRRAERRARFPERSGLLTAAAFLIASLACLVGISAAPDGPVGFAAMVAGPMFAAMAGALIRDSFGAEQEALKAVVRGLGAGVVSVLLFLSAQLLLNPEALQENVALLRLSFFLIPVGFTAGFTFDLVFDRLRRAELLRPPELAAPHQQQQDAGAAPPS
ncbi:hypothetical protein SAMN05421803_101709 [Nocardiopsis flavescens]|uniref:Uncharacterized protein n=1 Tax=Nocardiopsis flavescens TaxID=758803 RepID=A0A1M6CIE7_9ACTN|nr:hypothetical protein [Nocardiopsis flavescens]SHI60478.1 hypothetical protein SAMN05421803_101709 [Nocardiopsis flavescens]